MSFQHARPAVVSLSPEGPAPELLERVSLAGTNERFSEAWLQRLIFDHPELLPISEIEPAFGPLHRLCRELPTPVGPLDLLFTNPFGLLTLVECKLWRNPEARREVVGQLLDYAKEFTRWTYSDLMEAVQRSRHTSVDPLEQLRANTEDFDESAYIDAVTANLRRGRFLLLIVGDGIRESVEELGRFLQLHAHLNFSFALVETAVYRLPGSDDSRVLVQPRILCRTVEIERLVVRVEGAGIVVVPPKTPAGGGEEGTTRKRISEQVFYERLKADKADVEALEKFFGSVRRLGLVAEPGDKSLKLKSEDGQFTFAVFNLNGTVQNFSLALRGRELGIERLVDSYYDAFAELFPDGNVDRSSGPFRWTVRRAGQPLTLADCMQVRDRWFDLLERTVGEIHQAVA